jgi:hypothetical protein
MRLIGLAHILVRPAKATGHSYGPNVGPSCVEAYRHGRPGQPFRAAGGEPRLAGSRVLHAGRGQVIGTGPGPAPRRAARGPRCARAQRDPQPQGSFGLDEADGAVAEPRLPLNLVQDLPERYTP